MQGVQLQRPGKPVISIGTGNFDIKVWFIRKIELGFLYRPNQIGIPVLKLGDDDVLTKQWSQNAGICSFVP